ncbi:metal homeostatis protein bsd2 [Grosmannia clavigera kw1407]|uniref:Metal homeostatis protein bsd2 n=1 Tax=Grosmannia clavigera (strain kw1407 / UAMH 11150) TaxID=655863 RepID=F0XF38_GROCL|nr:metal homeostatis protein bsd2 [Grosmannia clavigera kw1407]EFX03922.1 metal homeostatis protein bsd2 [Grosmannia clavigera kw1407]
MSARYERVSGHDAEEPTLPRLQQAVPQSPPPSFRSRASSRSRRSAVADPTLADAFDTDGDHDSSDEDEADDRQRLVRQSSATNSSNNPGSTTTTAAAAAATRPSAAVPSSNRVYGGGIQSDGVFSNLTAKPEAGVEKEEQPPTYEQAAADSAPPYWETTILAPGLGGSDEVYVDGMPVGSVFSFVWNGMISMSFQVVGFLLTYLLHSTHAAKNGSRAGLGVTLIQYGFYMKSTANGGDDGAGGSGGMSAAGAAAASGGTGVEGYAAPPDPNAHNFDPNAVSSSGGGAHGAAASLQEMASSEWVAYVLMIVGWFILIRAVSDYLRARRHEQLVLQSPDRGLGVAVIAEGEQPEQAV